MAELPPLPDSDASSPEGAVRGGPREGEVELEVVETLLAAEVAEAATEDDEQNEDDDDVVVDVDEEEREPRGTASAEAEGDLSGDEPGGCGPGGGPPPGLALSPVCGPAAGRRRHADPAAAGAPAGRLRYDDAAESSSAPRGGDGDGGDDGAEDGGPPMGAAPAAVRACAAQLCADQHSTVTFSARDGWTAELCATYAAPPLARARRLRTVALLDLLSYDAAAEVLRAVAANPYIQGVVLAGTSSESGVQMSLRTVQCVAQLLRAHPALEELAVTNCMHAAGVDGMRCLADGVAHAACLRRLVLECNGITDDALLPLAQALAARHTVMHLDLSHNMLGYQGFEMLCEVLGYNHTLCYIGTEGNSVHAVNDTWEGFHVQEECAINRELIRLGAYTRDSHQRWPLPWRREAAQLWRAAWRVARRGGAVACGAGLWAMVMDFVDPRLFVAAQVRLWMKIEPPAPAQRPAAPEPAATNWRHV